MATRETQDDLAVAAPGPHGREAVEAAYDSCLAATKEGASNFYYAFLTLPREMRRAIYAAYAFCRLCDDIVDEPAEDGARPRERLEEVRQALGRTYAGEPKGDLWLALNDAGVRFGIRRRHLLDVVDGVEMDLGRVRYETFEDLRRYCYRVASAVGLVCIEVCGYEDERAVEYAIDLGVAMQLTNILRDIREDAQQGRVYLPQEDLRRYEYTEEDLLSGVVDDRFRALMAFEVDRARRYFESGASLFPLLERRARACSAGMHAVYSRILDRIESAGYDVYSERITLSAPVRFAVIARLWLRSLIPGLG